MRDNPKTTVVEPKSETEINEETQKSGYSLRSRESHRINQQELKGNKLYLYDDSKPKKKKRKLIKTNMTKRAIIKKNVRKSSFSVGFSDEEDANEGMDANGEHYYDKVVMAKLPKNRKKLDCMIKQLDSKICHYKNQYFTEMKENATKKSQVPEISIPITADVTSLDWNFLSSEQMKHGGRLFDVIMMDPPWQLSSSQPSRGVAIGYDSLSDELISKIPVPKLQTAGFIFIWVINAKYSFTCKLMDSWGYKLVDEIAWIKKTVNGKIAKGHGFYLQHAKETCLVGIKGEGKFQYQGNTGCDVIFSERRGQSQKPNEIYDLVEKLVPNGFYLEIFARRNNLHNKWVSIGNEL